MFMGTKMLFYVVQPYYFQCFSVFSIFQCSYIVMQKYPLVVGDVVGCIN